MNKTVATLIAIVAGVLATASPAHAQRDTLQTQRVQLLQRVAPGTMLRVRMDSQQVVGQLQRVSSDTLYLEDRAVPTHLIDDIWLRQRATRTGAKWGAIIGAPAGAAFGSFVLLLVSALCESDCSDYGTGEAVVGALAFTTAGLVAGGALGAVIGAGIPKWTEITKAGARLPEAAPARPATRTIGSLSLTPALAHSASGDDSGFGLRLTYQFNTTHFSLGPEVGWYSLGTNTRPNLFCGPGLPPCQEETVELAENVFHAGGVARIGAGTDRRIEPYATLGAGLYNWGTGYGGSTALGAYSAGTGVQWRNQTGRRSLLVEGRWQSNLTNSGDPDPHFGFYTIGIGGTLSW